MRVVTTTSIQRPILNYVCMCVRVCMHVCVRACECVCACVCMYVKCMYNTLTWEIQGTNLCQQSSLVDDVHSVFLSLSVEILRPIVDIFVMVSP